MVTRALTKAKTPPVTLRFESAAICRRAAASLGRARTMHRERQAAAAPALATGPAASAIAAEAATTAATAAAPASSVRRFTSTDSADAQLSIRFRVAVGNTSVTDEETAAATVIQSRYRDRQLRRQTPRKPPSNSNGVVPAAHLRPGLPSDAEVAEQLCNLGVPRSLATAIYSDDDDVAYLRSVASESLCAPLPSGWREHLVPKYGVVFYSCAGRPSRWQHPAESLFRNHISELMNWRTGVRLAAAQGSGLFCVSAMGAKLLALRAEYDQTLTVVRKR